MDKSSDVQFIDNLKVRGDDNCVGDHALISVELKESVEHKTGNVKEDDSSELEGYFEDGDRTERLSNRLIVDWRVFKERAEEAMEKWKQQRQDLLEDINEVWISWVEALYALANMNAVKRRRFKEISSISNWKRWFKEKIDFGTCVIEQ
jgi:hypothetical protein